RFGMFLVYILLFECFVQVLSKGFFIVLIVMFYCLFSSFSYLWF
ncbi:hypothetical protein SAMN05444358_1284, partial [Ruegeria halocynthiae]